MSMLTIKDLIEILKLIPSHYSVHISDINYNDSFSELTEYDLRTDDLEERLYFPGTCQDYAD